MSFSIESASFSNIEFKRRHEKAKDLMEVADIDALLISNVYNYFYFSGHEVSSNKVIANTMRACFMILPIEGNPILIFYGQFLEHQKRNKTPNPWWDKIKDLRPYVDSPHMPGRVKDWGISDSLKDLGIDRGRIGCELGENTRLGMSFNDFLKLKKDLPEAEFLDASNIFWKCRMYKSEEEIKRISKACEITGKAWNKLWQIVKPGMTQKEIITLLAKIYIEEGSMRARPVVATPFGTGPKGEFVKGDIIRLDAGAEFKGYFSDYSRCACLGEPTDEQKKHYELIVDITKKLIDAHEVGVKMKDIHKLNNKLLKKAGFPKTDPIKRIGHGYGMELEPPSINQVDTWYNIVKPGLVLTPEPRFYKEGVNPGTFLYEEVVVIREDGAEVLSTNPNSELTVIEC